MSVDRRLLEMREQQAQLDATLAQMREFSPGGGGSGEGGNLEHRVGRQEGEVSSLNKQVTDLRVDSAQSYGDIKATLAVIDERTKSFGDVKTSLAVLDERTKSFGDVKTSLTALEERTKHMPTRWEVFLALAAVLGVAGTAAGLAARFMP